MKSLFAFGLAAGLLYAAAAPARAAVPVVLSAAPVTSPGVVLVADGCGAGWYRGPGGYCHAFGTGPYPNGYWGSYQVYYGGGDSYNGCPPGYWHGPWGHCRDTPYHGRLPDGGWQ